MEATEKHFLISRYDKRKSFYKKAFVKVQEDNMTKNFLLYSYNTLVAICTEDKKSPLVSYSYLGYFSQTTTRHQKEFFKQYGLNDDDIKELMKHKTPSQKDITQNIALF